MVLINSIKNKELGKRFLASLIDWIIVGMISIWMVTIISFIFDISTIHMIQSKTHPNDLINSYINKNVFISMFFLIGILYYSFLDGYLWEGTIGKRIFSLKTIKEFETSNTRLTFSESLMRTCYKYFSIFFFGIGLIIGMLDEKNKTLHDKLGKTIVTINEKELIYKKIKQEYFSQENIAFKRLIASFIDYNIIFFFSSIVTFIIFLIISNKLNSYSLALFIISYIILLCLIIIISLSWFESSKFQATPGKLLMNIFIVNNDNIKISFWRAMVRNICKCIGFNIILMIINIILMFFSKDKQTIHDLLVKTKVVLKQQ